jgi:hypothetical protein
MAEISNAQVVEFANGRARPMADKLYNAYYSAKSVLQDYTAGDIGTKIGDAGSGNLVADQSDLDGRTRITGGDIWNLITAVEAFIAFVEGGPVPELDRLDVLTKPHVNRIAE